MSDSAYNVTTLAALTGMPKATAAAWLRCEGSTNPTNPLNIRYWAYSTQRLGPHANGSPGVGFASYSSALAGLSDAARMVATSSHYGGIRNAIATRDAVKVAQAIEASPWANGNYGGGPGKAGCIVRGVNGGAAPSSSGPAIPAVSAVAPAPAAGVMPTLNIADGHILNAGDILYITQAMTSAGWFPGWGGAHSTGAAYLNGLVGQAWSPALLAQIAAHFGASQAPSAGDVPLADAFANLLNFGWVPGFAVNAGVLVLVVVLGYKGFARILG